MRTEKFTMQTAKNLGCVYVKLIIFAFGGLIIGFIGFAFFKGVIEPLAVSGSACNRENGCLVALRNGINSVRVLGFSPDGSQILTRGADTIIHDAISGDKVAKIDPDYDTKGFQTIISGDGTMIATLSNYFGENELDFFAADGEYIDGWKWPAERSIRGMAFVPQADAFALAGEDGVTLWGMQDGKLFLTLPNSEGANLMAGSADGSVLAAYNKDRDMITIWHLDKIDEPIVIPDAKVDDASLFYDRMQLSADGGRLAAYRSNNVNVWQTADGEQLAGIELIGDELRMNGIGLSADGNRIAIAFNDGSIEVWSIDGGEMINLFEHQQKPFSVALSPNGDKLAVGFSDDAVVRKITNAEKFAGRNCSYNSARERLGQCNPSDGFLTPGKTYIETSPGFALVYEVTPK